MQQTEKYQFNLIEGSDPFLPEALNENMEKAEGALAELTEDTATRFDTLTADTAARFAALPRVEVLTWVGDGEKSRTLTFQFQPKAVLLIPQFGDSLMPIAVEYGLERGYRYGYSNNSRYTYLTWNGTSVTMLDRTDSSTGVGTGAFNKSGTPYVALAVG